MLTNKSVLVSIGIPFFNSEKYLSYAITSVIEQTYTNWELILIDDGSTDKSLKIAEKYKKKDSRIRLLSDGENLGLPKRLNELSNYAKGKFYARMDADDMMHPNRIKKQVQYLQEHPNVDLVGTGLIAIDNHNNIIGLRNGLSKTKYSLKNIIDGQWCVHPTITGKTSWFKKNEYDSSLKRAQDYDLWVRTVQNSCFSKLEYPYLYYREASTPTLSKYYTATKHSLKIYWKNRKILTLFTCMKFSILKILKLSTYFLLSIFGATNILIQRRSMKLNNNDTSIHQKNITNLIEKSCNNI